MNNQQYPDFETDAYTHFLVGEFGEAERLYRRALIRAEMQYGSGHLRVAEALEELVRVLEAEGKNKEALAARERAMDIVSHCHSVMRGS